MEDRLRRIDWDNLKYFLAVARGGSSRQAGQKLRVNHATVARRVAELEDSVQARLFDRGQDGLRLTQLGEDLLPFAEKMEAELAAAAIRVSGRDDTAHGVVRLSIPRLVMETVLADYLAEFLQAYPEVELELQITNSRANLERWESDVSLRYAREVSGEAIGRKLVDCGKAIYGSPSYVSQIDKPGGEGLHFIGWTERYAAVLGDWVSETSYPAAKLRHRVLDPEGQLGLAARGLGLIIAPCFIADQLPGLVRAPFQSPQPDRNLWLLYHRDLRHTARVRALIDFLAERILKDRHIFTGGDQAGCDILASGKLDEA